MTKKKTTKKKTVHRRKKLADIKPPKKPTLIKCGNHFINPEDVSRITKINKGGIDLYSVKFKSEPNPNFACWVHGPEIISLLEQFNIISSDGDEVQNIQNDDPINW